MELKRSCWNCVHSVDYRTREIPQTYWEPGEPAMVEDCNAPLYQDEWDVWTEEFDKRDSNYTHEFEEYVACKCPHYKPEIYTCDVCKRNIPADRSILSAGIEEHSHTCSATCDATITLTVEQEIKELCEEETV